jgi:hypothetical protein
MTSALELLPEAIIRSEGYFLAESAEKLNSCARLRDPQSGEAKFAAFSSRRLAEEAVLEKGGLFTYIACMPFTKIIMACGSSVGMVINPFSDHLIVDLSVAKCSNSNPLS